MLSENNIKELLTSMSKNTSTNIKKIKKAFGSLEYFDKRSQNLLHIFVENKYDEEKCYLAVISLLQSGVNPNYTDDFNYNFIQTALYAGYSEKFILKIITEALKYKLDVNHVAYDKESIMHTAIYSHVYKDPIINIYKLLCENGYDSTKLNTSEHDLVKIAYEVSKKDGKFTQTQLEELKKFHTEEINKTSLNTTEDSTNLKNKINEQNEIISELEKYGTVLNKKKFIISPTIGREKEISNLLITLAQDKKTPLLVGESGVGKTAIVDELAFRIREREVPKFLEGKIILEITPSEIVAGCEYRGQFEDKMTKLLHLCKHHDIILFIDEIHTIYGTGRSANTVNDMSSILKHYIDRYNLKVIGTTTEKEYNEFFANDALKRRFEKIIIKEPDDLILYKIIEKTLDYYSLIKDLQFENHFIKDEIINFLIFATNKRNRVYNDVINNPDLAISLIDKAYALALVYDSKHITKEHFIESLELSDRIYDSTKKSAILNLRTDVKEDKMGLILDFNTYRKN